MIECGPPEVCAEDTRQEHLLVLEKRNHKDENVHSIQHVLRRDISLVRATIVLVILMNIPYGRYVLYPFTIFSTWIHEMCHGLMAILVGGGIKELHIYKDGSGLAFTYTSGAVWKRAFVASAGYMGTAFVGGILLLFRRTLHGPTIGIIGTGIAILLSCALFVRNWFGIGMLSLIGVVLILFGWRLKVLWVGELYAFLCIVTSFNALTDIKNVSLTGLEQRHFSWPVVAQRLPMLSLTVVSSSLFSSLLRVRVMSGANCDIVMRIL
jgi:hypothetical protein